MTESRKVVRVFLASPGDLGEERKLAKAVTDRWNGQWADFLGLQIELVGWEDTGSIYGRPQAIINQDLARCELFIGMLWQEWGTPTGEYSSGFEEEFRVSEKSRTEHGRPEISLLFKQVEESRKRDPGTRLKKVLDFQSEIRDRVLYQSFREATDFQEKFEAILTKYVQKLIGSERSPTAISDQGPSIEEPSGPRGGLPPAASAFVRDFVDRAQAQAVDPIELARFRLVGTALNASGNDDVSLGTHDANILFAARDNLDLTRAEEFALLDSGFDHFKSENTPLWHWLAAVRGFEGDILVLRSAFGPAERRVGALGVMRLLAMDIVEEGALNRDFYLDDWFGLSTPESVKVAALRYLRECGDQRDLSAVKAEIDRANYQTTKTAIAAYIAILCRESRDKAVAALNELQPESLDDDLIETLFSKGSAIAEESLQAAISHRAPSVRRAAAKELRARSALTGVLALQLSEDDDAGVRLEALLCRLSNGEEITDSTARQILVRKKRGAVGFFNVPSPREEGQEELRLFQKAALRDLTRLELQRLAEAADVLGQEYAIELHRRAFASQGAKLRAAIRDEFKSWFDLELAKFEAKVSNPDVRTRIRNIEGSLREDWLRQTIDVLVEKGGGADVALLRQVFSRDDPKIEMTAADIRYFGKHGEWRDVDLLIAQSEQRRSRRPLLLSSYLFDGEELIVLAQALCNLARGRFQDLLAKEMPVRLVSAVLTACPVDAVRALDDATLLKWLKHQNDGVRRTLALRCVAALGKQRIARILDGFMQGTYYYNVVVWLDMGISCSVSTGRMVAKRALEGEAFA